jgi:ribulose-phosphate 3-epimerase
MIEVIPAVLVKDFEELRGSIGKFLNIAPLIQIDMCDGVFVPHMSWPYNEIRGGDSKNLDAILAEEEGLPYWDKLNFEFDLMVKDAREQFETFIRLGAKRVVFHLEAEVHDEKSATQFKEFLEGIDMYTRENLEIGLSIDTTTDIDNLKPFISCVDFVQCMGIAHDGSQGEPFDERVLAQIKSLRNAYPELIISVDGSVNADTAPLLVLAGANRLVVGSSLLNSYDIKEAYEYFENLE